MGSIEILFNLSKDRTCRVMSASQEHLYQQQQNKSRYHKNTNVKLTNDTFWYKALLSSWRLDISCNPEPYKQILM